MSSREPKPFTAALQRYALPGFEAGWGAIRRGIEKESLRVSPKGDISRRRHPPALGSALSNPYITTDFSEALLEFITPVSADIDECLAMLDGIHRFTLQNLEQNEILWTSSMPCPLDAGVGIRIAEYGDSNIGRLKNLYRKGLHHRYGSMMQVVAGLHYNFSMPDAFWPTYHKIRGGGTKNDMQHFRTECYLHLIRNFHRRSWLLLYLFGASPAVCSCFTEGRDHSLDEFDSDTLYMPLATCLRMSSLGYKSEAQKSLFVCYNELETYIDSLYQAMHTPYPDYEAMGWRRGDEFIQINTSLLQLENEFYSTIRPKRTVASGEHPLDGLKRDGIEYVEVRALDLDPYLPLGIDGDTVRFLDMFLLHCLLAESPECDEREFFETGDNIARVVERGRDLSLGLHRAGEAVTLGDWAAATLDDISHSAAILDHVHGGAAYTASLARQKAKLTDPALTPSGRILQEMQDDGLSFFQFAMRHSKRSSTLLLNSGNAAALGLQKKLQKAAAESLVKQAEVESADTLSFEEFLTRWNKG